MLLLERRIVSLPRGLTMIAQLLLGLGGGLLVDLAAPLTAGALGKFGGSLPADITSAL